MNLFEKRLVPVAVIEDESKAVDLATVLVESGLNVIEVTLRTKTALKSIRSISTSVPEMRIGAGTVLDHELIPELIDSGVSFVITPGINAKVVEAALEHQLPVFPGVLTPGEIEQARNFGLEVLKFFPAEAAGGVKVLKAFAGPYAHTGIKFIPTGGINLSNMTDYLSLPTVAAVGGSWFVSDALLGDGNFEKIGEMTREALSKTNSV